MDKLIPLDVSIRQHQLETSRKKQRGVMNQRHNDRQFDVGDRPTDKGSAFTDSYTASQLRKIRANRTALKDDMVHAMSSAPYTQGRKTK